MLSHMTPNARAAMYEAAMRGINGDLKPRRDIETDREDAGNSRRGPDSTARQWSNTTRGNEGTRGTEGTR